MGDTTAIEWCDRTFNPWWGCAHVSPGCRECYAELFAKRYGHDVWGMGGDRRLFGEKHWQAPVRWNAAAERAGVPAKVFCASMADVFEYHPAVVVERQRLWDLIARTPWLIWQLLTKRPENVAAMVPASWAADGWPANVWLGTTVEDQQRADERVPLLLAQPAVVRFLSCEPLLGPVRLLRWLHDGSCDYGYEAACTCRSSPVGWVICGGESGPRARPMHPGWARSLRNECAVAGVPFLFKQWGEHAPVDDGDATPFLIVPENAHGEDGPFTAGASMRRVGKKAAGRVLDGRTWDEFPAEVSPPRTPATP